MSAVAEYVALKPPSPSAAPALLTPKKRNVTPLTFRPEYGTGQPVTTTSPPYHAAPSSSATGPFAGSTFSTHASALLNVTVWSACASTTSALVTSRATRVY